MKELVDLLYAEIYNISEELSYLKGKCSSIVEICAINRFVNERAKKRPSKKLKYIEKRLNKVISEINNLSDKIPLELFHDIEKYQQQCKSQNKYLKIVKNE